MTVWLALLPVVQLGPQLGLPQVKCTSVVASLPSQGMLLLAQGRRRMALQNCADPWGRLQAIDVRGAWLGNRGALHGEQKKIVASVRRAASGYMQTSGLPAAADIVTVLTPVFIINAIRAGLVPQGPRCWTARPPAAMPRGWSSCWIRPRRLIWPPRPAWW